MMQYIIPLHVRLVSINYVSNKKYVTVQVKWMITKRNDYLSEACNYFHVLKEISP